MRHYDEVRIKTQEIFILALSILATPATMPNPIIPYNPALKQLASKLRKESTKGEIILWKHIRNKTLSIQFHRQVPVDNYIIDFYSQELRLAIEIDGASHDDEQVSRNDIIRQTRLESLGIQFLRFPEKEVYTNLDRVLKMLKATIEHYQTLRR
jgi:very-short-patch-repair endonuclease